MKADCHSPLSAWTPWGVLPIADQTVPIAPAPVLGGSRSCALVSNPPRLSVYEANRREGDGACQNQSGANPHQRGMS